mgnify:CR=1 FL=1
MLIAKSFGCTLLGVNANLVTIEVTLTEGDRFYMVGLPDNAVKESQHRVVSAIKYSKFRLPLKKVVVNLAPADIKKEGSSYDLPIALSILKATHQLKSSTLDKYLIMGELSLDGQLRPIKGVLPIAIEARRLGFRGMVLPKENGSEAAIVDNLEVIAINSMLEAVQFFEGKSSIKPLVTDTRDIFYHDINNYKFDLAEVKGQEHVKRALEITAAGGHNTIMIGAPGSGKTMLAKRIPSILPPLSLHEALETTKIHSVAGKLSADASLMTTRPFRAPHQTVSDVALVGGGGNPQPGEISLAHNGVLFLDELPEFQRRVLEVLRQPMEERKVTISRAKSTVDYPANFMLIASMNPCPCGYYNHPDKECLCPPGTVQRYLNKISGPLMDRIDIHLEVTPVAFEQMMVNSKGESSKTVRERVIKARESQGDRFQHHPEVHSNAMMTTKMVNEVCHINQAGKALLSKAIERLGLSARAYTRVLKVSRTIADLAGSDSIGIEHLAEAIQYRTLDKGSIYH